MRYCFAPMEGITDSIFRRVHHRYFPGLDRYYMPFFSPAAHRKLTAREARELPEADPAGAVTIPQVLTKNPEDFIWAAALCRDLGYPEINLNLGCPSGTVVAKGKGSGMLADLELLDRFLDTVFSRQVLPISVKTRLGLSDPEEFSDLLKIFNRYPLAELIIHPRVRQEFYKGAAHGDLFLRYASETALPLCYNGDIRGLRDIRALSRRCPDLPSVMIGRGLLADPGMLSPGGTTPALVEQMHRDLLEGYLEAFGGSRNAMFRLKENWSYLITGFSGSEKLWKRMRNTTDLQEYQAIVREILDTCPFHGGPQ